MLRSPHLRVPLAAFVAAAAALASAQYAGSKPVPSELKTGWDLMTEASAREILTRLTSREFAGRGTGQKGYLRAAQYVADQFKSYGVKGGMPDGSYFQMVPFTEWSSHPASKAVDPSGKTLKPGIDFDGAGVTGDVKAEGRLAFFAGPAADITFNEENCEGRIVVVDSPGFSRRNASLAIRSKALAVIQVLEEADNNPTVVFGHDAQSRGQVTPRFHISRAKFRELASASGYTGSNHFLSDKTMSIDWKIEKKNIGIPNVVGKIEGSDPVLKNEFVAMGCHLDHMGITDGVMYPGADDDGSGTTALMLLAKSFAANPVKSKRTLVFMAFAAEEIGLIGARHMSDNSPFDLDKMSCLLQMDMIGRNEETENDRPEDNVQNIHLVGSKRISSELHALTLKANEHIGFTFEYDQEDVYTRSDHAMFARKGVPITFVFSGFHPDYHRPTDTIEKINFDKLISTARLNYLVASWAASAPALLKRDSAGS